MSEFWHFLNNVRKRIKVNGYNTEIRTVRKEADFCFLSLLNLNLIGTISICHFLGIVSESEKIVKITVKGSCPVPIP